uniref:Homeobox containing 1 n=1 Tax=Neolamprologus brichardi TaxID=32507 RepID=A0A3Q4GRZ7_NEOBR
PIHSSSRMSEFSEEPRFTIEQIDLLQRLRRTGMTKQEILHALDTLDRLDREHGDKFGRRTSSSSSSSSSYGVGGANSCTNNSASNTTTTTQCCCFSRRTRRSGRQSHRDPRARSGLQSDRDPRTSSGRQSDRDPRASSGRQSDRDPRAITVSAVLSFCHSNHSDCRLVDSAPPAAGATLNMRPAPLPLEEMEWRQTPPPLTTAPGTFRLRRGSRFTWRKECLAVMERFHGDAVCVFPPGKKLSDLERVTSLKVYNWFANRRKEIKRRANIEATILESHGIDVQSPGGHSNSDDIDGNDFSEQDDSAAHSEHQDPISLAVEMAAVNHTILALSRTGGGPNDIKTESLEDE